MQKYNKNQELNEDDFEQVKPNIARKFAITESSINQILHQLRHASQKFGKQQVSLIKSMRKNKQKQYRKAYAQDIYQDDLKPGDAVPRVFSCVKPLNGSGMFLDQKSKARLLTSDRAFSKKPNIISGACRERVLTETPFQQRQWINRKFKDYNQIVNQQTGPIRLFLKKRSQQLSGTATKKPIYGKLNTTSNLFSVFQSDKNDYYQDLKQTVSTAFSFKCKTQTSLQTNQFYKEGSHLLNRQLKKTSNLFIRPIRKTQQI